MSARTEQDVARIALSCLDLTSLNDNDTEADVLALCQRAATAHGPPAALCVWPQFAAVAVAHAPPRVRVAAVANFPDGSLDMQRAQQTMFAVDEVRTLLSQEDYEGAATAARDAAKEWKQKPRAAAD